MACIQYSSYPPFVPNQALLSSPLSHEFRHHPCAASGILPPHLSLLLQPFQGELHPSLPQRLWLEVAAKDHHTGSSTRPPVIVADIPFRYPKKQSACIIQAYVVHNAISVYTVRFISPDHTRLSFHSQLSLIVGILTTALTNQSVVLNVEPRGSQSIIKEDPHGLSSPIILETSCNMAVNVHVDSELMQHIQGAVAVPDSRRFSAVRDEKGLPLIFSISTIGVFYAIKNNGLGGHRLHNLGARLGKSGIIQAFAVSQAANGRLFIVFAQQRSATDKTGDLFMLELDPAQLNDADDVTMRQNLFRAAQQPAYAIFERIHLGPYSPGAAPVLVAVAKNSKQDTDIARVVVDFATRTWTWKLDLDLPENANKMIDLVPGKLRSGPGIFYLYAFNGKQSLVFITTELDEGRFYRVALSAPAGASSLAIFVDPQGYTPLLVGGKGLHYYTATSANRSNSVPVTISTSSMYDVVNNLVVAQAQNAISIWFENGTQTLGYQEGDRTKTPILTSDPVPLLPPGQGAEFTVVLDQSSKSKTLIVANNTGSLSAMEQANDTRLWKSVPLNVPSIDTNVEYTVYNTHIQVKDAQGWPIANTVFTLASTGWVTTNINGRTQTLGATGVPVSTDASGAITILVPTTDIASYHFYLSSPDSKYIPSSNPIKINPSSKVDEKLSLLGSGTDLQSVRFEDGTGLMDGSKASAEEIKQASAAIKDLNGVRQTVAGSSTNTLSQTDSAIRAASTSVRTTTSTSSTIKSQAWDMYHWVEGKVEEAWNWVIERVDGLLRLVVKLGDIVYAFVLDTVERIGKAINFIIKKIGILWDQFVKWVGFIFNWGDIVNTAKSIVTITNAALDYGEQVFASGADKAEAFFTDLQQNLTRSISSDVALNNASSNSIGTLTGGAALKPEAQGAAVNWSKTQYEHGGIRDGMTFVDKEGGTGGFANLWSQTILPLLSGLEDPVLNKLASQVVNVFHAKREISVSEILKTIGTEILIKLVDVFKKISVEFMKIGAMVFGTVRSILNAEINIPVIGPLFSKIMRGEPLTFLNALSLLVAIPVTIMSKIITGAAPQRLLTFDYGRMVNGGVVDKQTFFAYNELASYIQIIVYSMQSAFKVYKIGTAEEADAIKTFDPPTNMSLVSSLVTKAFLFPWDRSRPAWPLRMTIWSLACGNIILKGVCSKITAPTTKVVAVVEAAVGISNFIMFQVVHGFEYADTDWKGHSIPRTTMNIIQTVYMLVGSISSAYGQVIPEPIEKAACGLVVQLTEAYVKVMLGAKIAVKNSEGYTPLIDGVD